MNEIKAERNQRTQGHGKLKIDQETHNSQKNHFRARTPYASSPTGISPCKVAALSLCNEMPEGMTTAHYPTGMTTPTFARAWTPYASSPTGISPCKFAALSLCNEMPEGMTTARYPTGMTTPTFARARTSYASSPTVKKQIPDHCGTCASKERHRPNDLGASYSAPYGTLVRDEAS